MTKDFSRLKIKIDNINVHNDKLLISKIDDVNSLEKSFELLKTKVRRLESDLEEATKISEYKSVFLANMSYEIRTPLNSVLGMINMLKQSQLTTDQQIQLEIAEYSSEHVMQLVSMILDNSKVEGGKIELELSAIDLKSDLSKLVKVFEYEAWDSGLDFEFKFLADEKEKFLLLGDLKRIKQIITNLMSNAIKFTNSGKVSLVIDQTVGPDDYQSSPLLTITASTARFRSSPPIGGLVGRVLRTGCGRCRRLRGGFFLGGFRSRGFGGRFGGARVRPSGCRCPR